MVDHGRDIIRECLFYAARPNFECLLNAAPVQIGGAGGLRSGF